MKKDGKTKETSDIPIQARNEIVIYQPDETLRLETRYAHESIWLTQLKIAELFGVQKAAISKHLKNIYVTGELDKTATVSKMETVQQEGSRKIVRRQDSCEFGKSDTIPYLGNKSSP